jgi:flavin-dependent dehydrogenase
MTQQFDIPLRSGRQLWWEWSRERVPEKSMVRVQTSGGRILPRYEKGIGTVIKSLSIARRDIGNYLWSEQAELYEDYREFLQDKLASDLKFIVRTQIRRKDWRENTEKLIKMAIKDCAHNHHVEPRAGKLYTYEQLGQALGCDEDTFRKAHIEKWNFLKDILVGWLNEAEQPLYGWINEKRRAQSSI